MDLKEKFEQYGVLVVGLLIGGGFAFGGIASYAGLVGGGPSPGQEDQVNLTVPSENYREDSFGLGPREQVAVAYRNNLVFVNGFYSSEEDLEQLRGLESLPGEFDDRVYVQLLNSSSVEAASFRVQGSPSVIVVGAKQPRYVRVNGTSTSEVSGGVCQVMSSWTPAIASKCR